MDEKCKQVADQCRVVAHLAKAIHEVYSDKARMFASNARGPDDIVDVVGNWSARHMEALGNILNGMDAAHMDDPKPIIVACQCGWQGDQRDVISIKHSATRYCPVCGRLFRQWPPNNANQQRQD